MNLSRLLAYRRQIEDALRIELAAAARVVHEAAEQAASHEAEATAKQRHYAEAALAGLTVEETCRWYEDIEQAAVTARRSADTHAVLHREWMNKQAMVVEAMQERKKLAILMSRQTEARQQEELHADQRLMDEQAGRRRRGEPERAGPTGWDSHE